MKRTDLTPDQTERLFNELFPDMPNRVVAARIGINEVTLWRYKKQGLPSDMIQPVIEVARDLSNTIARRLGVWQRRAELRQQEPPLEA